jgi:hypothetical protein
VSGRDIVDGDRERHRETQREDTERRESPDIKIITTTLYSAVMYDSKFTTTTLTYIFHSPPLPFPLLYSSDERDDDRSGR